MSIILHECPMGHTIMFAPTGSLEYCVECESPLVEVEYIRRPTRLESEAQQVIVQAARMYAHYCIVGIKIDFARDDRHSEGQLIVEAFKILREEPDDETT